jgi:ParB family transcriptional regulator, chromosome partitioning protein
MGEKHLGRGFDSLLNNNNAPATVRRPFLTVEIPIDRIAPNPLQPRRIFDDETIRELADSISRSGILTPVLVRRSGDKYLLIAGERRLRAAQMAGLQRIPAIVRDADDMETLELSLIENIQREDLNPLDKASAYYDLMTKFNLTQDQVAEKLGQNRASVANYLRLMNLPESVQDAVKSGKISFGHAKAILACDDPERQTQLCIIAVESGMSVRELEKLATEELPQENASGQPKRRRRREGDPDPAIAEVEDYLRRFFGTRVLVKNSKSKGRIVIEYFSIADLNRILTLLEEKKPTV